MYYRVGYDLVVVPPKQDDLAATLVAILLYHAKRKQPTLLDSDAAFLLAAYIKDYEVNRQWLWRTALQGCIFSFLVFFIFIVDLFAGFPTFGSNEITNIIAVAQLVILVGYVAWLPYKLLRARFGN